MPVPRRSAVLGKPIAHSLSPVLHMAAYRTLGLDGWQYGRVEMDEASLPSFLHTLGPEWAGLSLTMPLKRTIVPFGSPGNRWMRELGVANTVVFEPTDGAPHAVLYNTDVYGIARAFEQAGLQAGTGRHALVLGNGNTAMSALAAFAMMGGVGRVTVGARHPGRSDAMRAFGDAHGITVHAVTLQDALAYAPHADLAVNTIPGHGADGFADGLAGADRALHGTLLDVVYDPRPTRLMATWEALGGTVTGGQWMLLYQAVAQVLLMTGRSDGGQFDTCGHEPRDPQLERAMAQALKEAL